MAEQNKTLSEPEADAEEYTEEEQRQAEEAEKENEEKQSWWDRFTSFIFDDSKEETDNETTGTETVDYDSLSDEEKLVYDYMTSSEEEQKDYIYSNVKENMWNNYNMNDQEFLEAVESGWRIDENGEKQPFLGYKTIQDGEISYRDENGNRFDEVTPDEEAIVSDEYHCTLSGHYEDVPNWTYDESGDRMGYNGSSKHLIVSYSGELGEFEYDTTQWALAEKEISYTDEATGEEYTSTVQILKYIGTCPYGNQITIPNGLNSIDYSFEGTNIITAPNLYNSLDEDGNPCSTITSAHCAFKDCEYLEGFAKDYKTGESILNIGGSATMPDSLMDASGMFYGCSNLKETLSVAGDSCMDARSMYTDTDLWADSTPIEEVADFAAKFISVGVDALSGLLDSVVDTSEWEYNYEPKSATMDTGNSLLNSIALYGAYEGTGVINMAEINSGGRTDEETGQATDISGTTQEQIGMTVDDVNTTYQHEAEANAKENADEGIREINDAYVMTSGSNFNFQYKDENGDIVTTGNAKEYSENAGRQTGLQLLNIVDFAGAVVTEYGIASFGLGFLTDSKLLKVAGSIGIVAVGQIGNFLPDSLSSILSWVGEKVETVSPEVGGIINDIADVLGTGKELDTTSNHQQDYLSEKLSQAEEDDKEYKPEDGPDQTGASLSATVKTELLDKNWGLGLITNRDEEYLGSKETLVDQMTNNGECLVNENVIYTLTNAVNTNHLAFCDDLNEQAATEASIMATKYDNWAASSTEDDDGSKLNSKQLSSSQKTAVFNEWDTVYAGFEAYTNGALTKLQERDGLSDEEMKEYENALGQAMTSAMEPYIKMMEDMDNTYDILTDEQREQLESYNIPGISSSIGQTDEEKAVIEENEESIYETAGINDETDTTPNDDKNTEADVENNTEEDDAVNGQTSDKGNMAEDAFEEVMDAYEAEQSEQPEYKTFDSSLSA